MIPVVKAIEPSDFDAKVRKPGENFLISTPSPRSNDWKGHEYWRKAIDDLLSSYGGICAYSGSWTYRNPGHGGSKLPHCSVDHFRPKSKYPNKAYEWSNFRLVRARLNNKKSDHEDVIDPFLLQGRLFVLDFRSFLVRPHPALSGNNLLSVNATIDRLELNLDSDYVQERTAVVQLYCQNALSWKRLKTHWPFIAMEMIEQNFEASIRPNLPLAFYSLPTGPLSF